MDREGKISRLPATKNICSRADRKLLLCKKPIAFASRSLTPAECKYSQLDKEALVLVLRVKKVHRYVYGRKLTLKSDRKPLTHIFGEIKAIPLMTSGRVQHWTLTLGAHNYHIEFKKGLQNANADALSRLPLPTTSTDPPEVVN